MSLPRVAIVGMGGYAGHHRKAVGRAVESGQAVHTAQVAPPGDHAPFADELKAMRDSGIAIYDSLRELLAAERSTLDLVCVPTGIPLHRAMTTTVLDAGCNVLVEKPAAGSIQDVNAMIRARDAAARSAMVGYQHIYRPATHQLKAELLSGRFGRVRRVRGCCCWPRAAAYYGRNAWAGELALGDTWVLDGPHNNANAHSVNLLCFLAGSSASASAQPMSIRAELYRAKPIRTADTVSLRVQTAEEVEVFFAASHSTEQNVNPRFAVDTDDAVLEINDQNGVTVRWHDDRPDEELILAAEVREASSVGGAIARVSGDLSAPVCELEVARAQTLCACGSFESSPVRELPTALQVEGPEGVIAIDGMTAAVQAAFAEGKSFHEMGLDWATAGDEIDLAEYDYFPTFRLDPMRS
jgi:predicted dehydrogenase